MIVAKLRHDNGLSAVTVDVEIDRPLRDLHSQAAPVRSSVRCCLGASDVRSHVPSWPVRAADGITLQTMASCSWRSKSH